uniref:Uncharacterized protein n=1 Tax=Candidatus Kentrum sp. UNK TaxID=2126344 RepID=A0A451ATU5_9GAMM|nr:MAG: hypothetical protein BECKUNK1418G_GA0071005_10131 [Candidatus Kentron sp. UNK]VFK68386.1 MAG: hypothetical protein BECKUNK1418G_GA0071005_12315 [Candidatus Kentron sp. UNK]VFK69445.1 MAG: hypothetical protein BECKUNK1418H_GA0071006_10141 [Candidatus Kentron sp. UNK]VFK73554.1 MAG: hypothetical protein BECKUNK1418H_GA0071006_12185 [Candidatus Kentron sp. UNK]
MDKIESTPSEPETDEPQTLEEQIEHFAFLQFTDDQISKITQMDVESLIETYGEIVDKGRLLGEAKLREAAMTLALQGRSPAQSQMFKLNVHAKKTARRRYSEL